MRDNVRENQDNGITLEALNAKLDETKDARFKDFKSSVPAQRPLSTEDYSVERLNWIGKTFTESVMMGMIKKGHITDGSDLRARVEQFLATVDDSDLQDKYKVGSYDRRFMISAIGMHLFYNARMYHLVEEPYKKEEVLQDFEGICESVKEAAALYQKMTSVRFSSGTNIDTVTSIVNGMSQIDAKTSGLLKEFYNKFPSLEFTPNTPGKGFDLFFIPYDPFTVRLRLSFVGWSVEVGTNPDSHAVKRDFLQKVKVLETMPRGREWTEDDFAAALEEKNNEGKSTPRGLRHETRTAIRRKLYE